MDEKDKITIKQIHDLVEDNNKKISLIYRAYWWGRVWKSVYWFVVVLLIFGGYIAVRPYIDQFREGVQRLMGGL